VYDSIANAYTGGAAAHTTTTLAGREDGILDAKDKSTLNQSFDAFYADFRSGKQNDLQNTLTTSKERLTDISENSEERAKQRSKDEEGRRKTLLATRAISTMPSPPPTVGAKAAAHVAEYAVAEAPKSTLEPHWATQRSLRHLIRGGSALDEGVSTLRNDFRYAMGQDYLPHHYGAYESNSVRRQGEDAPTMTAILRGRESLNRVDAFNAHAPAPGYGPGHPCYDPAQYGLLAPFGTQQRQQVTADAQMRQVFTADLTNAALESERLRGVSYDLIGLNQGTKAAVIASRSEQAAAFTMATSVPYTGAAFDEYASIQHKLSSGCSLNKSDCLALGDPLGAGMQSFIDRLVREEKR